MSKLDKDTENYLKSFSEKFFRENDFVTFLFQLLSKNGVYKIDEHELKKKLYYYYDSPEFRELFQDICKSKELLDNAVDIENGLYMEKYFGGNIIWTSTRPSILHFHYDNLDLSKYAEKLSEDGIVLMQRMVQEIAIRTKVESQSIHKMNIYACDPNKHYTLTHGQYLNRVLSWQLITDGDIKFLEYPDTAPFKHVFFDNPEDPNTKSQLDNSCIAYVTLNDASYAVMQGLSNKKIKHINVFTNLVEPEKLQQISEVANAEEFDEESLLIQDEPHVRKIKLK